ncbi:alpha/beta hydrolase [Alkalihalobacillus sp. MEB130]|uniref:alpha/beta fold hydrolase n=1 Tax=Alkalihalobacillus sp. MEB130 TaxID=2976704 RepID=UPI0028DD6B2D|nr:alpha/beta hydrolase [Alkalihalobacillus sp. MEB130]MDT8859734.1 alpha/beta hydrolase [Alkalihalobacillus sp. MEB130]
MENNVEFHYIKTNGITIHTAVAGPKDGPLVILLHGFPEFWYGWKNQIGPLAEAGNLVVAPDQRGYNVSDKPEEVDQYTLDVLRDDIIGIITHFNKEKASVIGHDWGGAVAWHLGATRPEYVDTLIPINMPHPAVLEKIMMKCPSQFIRSFYILLFQIPFIPEKALVANRFQLMKSSILHTCCPNSFTEIELEHYIQSWDQPNALTAMLNWYRAIRLGSLMQVPKKEITIPVRMLWGKNDPFLSLKLAKESIKLCSNGELVLIDDATHWVHHEQVNIVNRFLLTYLSR